MTAEKEEHVNKILETRKQEREIKRKTNFYLRNEEERQQRLEEEEEARKREGIYMHMYIEKFQLSHQNHSSLSIFMISHFIKFCQT